MAADCGREFFGNSGAHEWVACFHFVSVFPARAGREERWDAVAPEVEFAVVVGGGSEPALSVVDVLEYERCAGMGGEFLAGLNYGEVGAVSDRAVALFGD